MRSSYVEKAAIASILEANILYEKDRLEEETMIRQNDLNKQSKSVDMARDLLGEGLEEFQRTRYGVDYFDVHEENFMRSLFTSIKTRVNNMKEVYSRARNKTKSSTFLFGRKIDSDKQHESVLSMADKVDKTRDEMIEVLVLYVVFFLSLKILYQLHKIID